MSGALFVLLFSSVILAVVALFRVCRFWGLYA